MILNPVRIASGGGGAAVGTFTTGSSSKNTMHTLSLPFTPSIIILKKTSSVNNDTSCVAIYGDEANTWNENTVTLRKLDSATTYSYAAIPKSD